MPSTDNFISALKSVISLFFVYLFVQIVFSMISVEQFIQFMPAESKLIVRLTSNFSLVFSTLYAGLFLVGMMFVVWFISKICFEDLKTDTFISALQTPLILLVFAEILKFGFFWLFLQDEISQLDFTSQSFIQQIEKTNYHHFCLYADVASVFISGLFYFNELDLKYLPKLIISSLVVASLFLIEMI